MHICLHILSTLLPGVSAVLYFRPDPSPARLRPTSTMAGPSDCHLYRTICPEHSPGYGVAINAARFGCGDLSDVTPTCLHDLFRLSSSWPALSLMITVVQMLVTSLQRYAWSLGLGNLLSWLERALLFFFLYLNHVYWFLFCLLISF